MIRLPDTLAAWDAADFEAVCRREVAALGVSGLPLQRCLVAGSHVLPKPVSVTLLGAEKTAGVLRIRVGVFFTSTIAGCSCADDPTPANELNEYGVLRLEIDPVTTEVHIDPEEG